MKASDILKLTPDRGRHVCNHDGDCGQIRQPAVQVRLGGGTGKTSVTTGRSSRPVSRTPRFRAAPPQRTFSRTARNLANIAAYVVARMSWRNYPRRTSGESQLV